MKKRSNTITIIVTIILIFMFIFSTIISVKYVNKITITQLGNQSHSQMMGYVIKTYNDKVIVIDGGTSEDTQNLIEQINSLTGKVDHWFITHPHKDHSSCIIDVIENTDIKIDNIYVSLNELEWYKKYEPERAEEAEKLINSLQSGRIKENVIEVNVNDTIQIDNITCEILGVKNPEITTNAINNSSMVLRFLVNNKSIIFLGDTGEESSKKLIETQPKEKLKSDIVQMAHHGQSGATEELYKIISPNICLWPTPDWLWTNDAGNGEDTGTWKTKETREWMNKLDVKQHIIEKDGNKTITVW